MTKTFQFVLVVLVVNTFSFSTEINSMENSGYINFESDRELQNWVIVNDTVMGGRSRAGIDIQNGYLLFGGELSLQNNGGFASTRRVYDQVEWQNNKTIELTVMGDGRSYQFRLRNNAMWDSVAYVANFETKVGELTVHQFEIDDFEPLFRGRFVSNAPPLKFEDVKQVGFMLADKKEGKFLMKVKSIQQR